MFLIDSNNKAAILKMINATPSEPYDAEQEQKIAAELERRKAERARQLSEKLAQREERQRKLEEKLAANKAVALGKELFQTNDIFSKEHRAKHQAMMEKLNNQQAKMEEHQKVHDTISKHMLEKAQKHNAESEAKAKEHAEKTAAWKAEQERLKAERLAKKQEDERKWQEYEKRKTERRSSLGNTPPVTPVAAPKAKVQRPIVVAAPPKVEETPAPQVKVEPAAPPAVESPVAAAKPKAPKTPTSGKKSAKGKLNLASPCLMHIPGNFET